MLGRNLGVLVNVITLVSLHLICSPRDFQIVEWVNKVPQGTPTGDGLLQGHAHKRSWNPTNPDVSSRQKLGVGPWPGNRQTLLISSYSEPPAHLIEACFAVNTQKGASTVTSLFMTVCLWANSNILGMCMCALFDWISHIRCNSCSLDCGCRVWRGLRAVVFSSPIPPWLHSFPLSGPDTNKRIRSPCFRQNPPFKTKLWPA